MKTTTELTKRDIKHMGVGVYEFSKKLPVGGEDHLGTMAVFAMLHRAYIASTRAAALDLYDEACGELCRIPSLSVRERVGSIIGYKIPA